MVLQSFFRSFSIRDFSYPFYSKHKLLKDKALRSGYRAFTRRWGQGPVPSHGSGAASMAYFTDMETPVSISSNLPKGTH